MSVPAPVGVVPEACERGQRPGCLVSFSHACRPFRPVMEVPTLKPLSEDQARFYFQDLIKGIEYCKRGLWEASLPGVGRIPRWWGESGKFPISLLEREEEGGKQNCLRCRVTGSCREPLPWPPPGSRTSSSCRTGKRRAVAIVAIYLALSCVYQAPSGALLASPQESWDGVPVNLLEP